MTDGDIGSPVRRPPRVLLRLLRIAAWTAVAPLVALLMVLGTLFLHFSPLPWAPLRTGLAVALGDLNLRFFFRPRELEWS